MSLSSAPVVIQVQIKKPWGYIFQVYVHHCIFKRERDYLTYVVCMSRIQQLSRIKQLVESSLRVTHLRWISPDEGGDVCELGGGVVTREIHENGSCTRGSLGTRPRQQTHDTHPIKNIRLEVCVLAHFLLQLLQETQVCSMTRANAFLILPKKKRNLSPQHCTPATPHVKTFTSLGRTF